MALSPREQLRLLCEVFVEHPSKRSDLSEDELVAQIYHVSGQLVLEMLNEHVKSE